MENEIKRPASILHAIANIRYQFGYLNLKPPVAIHLDNHDDGMRFLSCMHDGRMIGYPDEACKPMEMADGSIFMELTAMGIKIRWPAAKWANPDGSWRYV